MAAIWNICKRGAPSANTSLACCRSTYVARQGGRHDRTHPRWSLRMSLTKKQLDNIRRSAERGSGAWTGEAIYDWRKLLVELDRLSLIEIKYDNLCPVLNEQAGEIERLKDERRPLLDLLGVEPGRISGSLARLWALLAVGAPYTLAAQWAWLLWGVKISPMSVWKVVQRLGESAAGYSEGMSRYHADSRREGASTREAPPAVG